MNFILLLLDMANYDMHNLTLDHIKFIPHSQHRQTIFEFPHSKYKCSARPSILIRYLGHGILYWNFNVNFCQAKLFCDKLFCDKLHCLFNKDMREPEAEIRTDADLILKFVE